MTNRIIKSRTKIRSSRKYRKRYVRKNSSKLRNKTAKHDVINKKKRRTVKMKGGAGSWSCKCQDPQQADENISKVGDVSKDNNDAKVMELMELHNNFKSPVIQPTTALPPSSQQVSATAVAAVAASTAAAIQHLNTQNEILGLQLKQQLPELLEQLSKSNPLPQTLGNQFGSQSAFEPDSSPDALHTSLNSSINNETSRSLSWAQRRDRHLGSMQEQPQPQFVRPLPPAGSPPLSRRPLSLRPISRRHPQHSSIYYSGIKHDMIQDKGN